MSVHDTGPVILLTALSVEYRAIRQHLSSLCPQSHPEGTHFEVGCLPGGGEAVIGLLGAGNARAGVLVERSIAMYKPRALIFVGVAGALKDWLDLGDVVVATKVYGYEGGSYEGGTFHARPNAWDAPHGLEQLARHIEQAGTWVHHLGPDTASRPPKVHFEPIASGSVLLNSREGRLAEQLRHHFNDAAAIEMEGLGVAQAGHLNASYPVLTIRGISDRADGSKDHTDRSGWQPSAAANAAALAIALAEALTVTASPSQVSPASDSPAQGGTGVDAQENEVAGSGTLFGVLDGDLIVHDEGQGQPLAGPRASRRAEPPGPKPSRTQRNMVRDNGQLFAVQNGDMHLHRLPGQQPPPSSSAEMRETDERA